MNYNEIRRKTRAISVGNIKIGGNAPISVQSMTNTPSEDYAATYAQMKALEAAGCDIVRMTVPTIEAAQVLGYTGGQTFGRIILPQMVKRVIPAVTNEVITLVKDTSLASVIGTVEMFTRAKQIVASPNTPGMLALVAAGVFYYVFNYVVAFAMEKWEQALRYYR